ncbi:MAG: hypothetical protein HY568_01895 [Candidatus Latescibacteria bacterium]|nr:hypothetical protein [Candidatus Latescibacterota bacterium]
MEELWNSLVTLNWNDPRVIVIVVTIAIVALVRKWSFVLLLALIIALGQGLEYLLQNSTLGPEFTRGVVIGVYGFGGVLLLFLAIAHFFTKE